ncbi:MULTISPECIES: hypothetical protein [unclassified Streptomyces]|uniref:hypothetical protein n=1 Tax=unclassified Streptomyces TaxID=2593676 RepID=UPI000823D4B5|nr:MULTISPECIES: hypothetical protein [unclassified Streptomyces]MYU00666.1 hypothetical protein [Streptomyces sp. SID8350]SCK09403.1 hypothetical protein YUWDRAFT_00396 [Streptomyces sp. AmelKG-D3]
MTACAIEGGTAGAATAADPGPETAGPGPDGPGEAEETGGRGGPGGVGEPVGAGEAGGAGGRAPGAPHAPDVLTLTADGAYGARLTAAPVPPGGQRAWYPERWTLDGPEPYAVPLPLNQPEEPDAQVVPLADGRVLIRRRVADRQMFSLLYPTGPATGELALGAVECEGMVLLPPSPDGRSVYGLTAGDHSSLLWLVAGGSFGPELVAEVPGHCSGGVWLDRAGRMLALDRRPAGGGPVKAFAVDLERNGEVTPLLQIAPASDDRLLLADPDSGLLLIRSNAPGHDRLGWGVLGSCLPVRFPECLRPADGAVTPFAVQPGQMLMPESCAVALRVDGPAGSWVGIWRPQGRRLHQFAAPEGWSAGAGFWTRDGVLHLPYATPSTPCGVALLDAPGDEEPPPEPGGTADGGHGTEPSAAAAPPAVCKPVPLGQAPLHRVASTD